MYQPNWTQVLIVSIIDFVIWFNFKGKGTEVIHISFIFHFQENGNELPQNPDTNWTVVECQHGWEYDRSEFASTLVTEVTINQIKETQFKFKFTCVL